MAKWIWKYKEFRKEFDKFFNDTDKMAALMKSIDERNNLLRKNKQFDKFITCEVDLPKGQGLYEYIGKVLIKDELRFEEEKWKSVRQWRYKGRKPRELKIAKGIEDLLGVKRGTLYEIPDKTTIVQEPVEENVTNMKNKAIDAITILHEEIFEYIKFLFEPMYYDDNDTLIGDICKDEYFLRLSKMQYIEINELLMKYRLALPKDIYEILSFYVAEFLGNRWYDGKTCKSYPNLAIDFCELAQKTKHRKSKNYDRTACLWKQISDIYDIIVKECLQKYISKNNK